MSEWFKEHAWKAKRASNTEPRGSTLTLTRLMARTSKTITRCAAVNLHVFRGFEADVSHSYHNPFPHLASACRYASVLIETRVVRVRQTVILHAEHLFDGESRLEEVLPSTCANRVSA